MDAGKPKLHPLGNGLYLFGLSWELSRSRVAHEFVRAFLTYARWVFDSVIFTRYVVTSISIDRPLPQILFFVAAAMCFFGVSDFYMRWFQHRHAPITDNLMSADLSRRLFDKAGSIDLACYEDSEFYDRFTLAQKEASGRLASFISNASNAVAALIAVFSVIASVIAIDPLLIAFIAFPMIGNFVFGTRSNAAFYERDKAAEPFARRVKYVNRILYLPEYAKEIRLSRIMRVLENHLEVGTQGIIDNARRYFRKGAWLDFFKNVFTFMLPFQGAFLFGAYLAIVRKSIGVGEFAVIASAVVSASWMIIRLSGYITGILKDGLFAENLRTFFAYENKVVESKPAQPLPDSFETLEFKDLSFTYKGAEAPALREIDFSIKKGEKVALVGHNGAGKTSLVKLLLRLYDPESGVILLNGIPIKNLAIDAYRGLFATAFQDYKLFSMSVAENVLLRKAEGGNREIVERALRQSGAFEKVMRFDKGIDTAIGREHDDQGALLSGGETQKVALARAFAKDFTVAVFDEPSSALDPQAELQLFKAMMESCAERTVIFISHRLSSATLADRVCLMENGRIVEEGSHEELMSLRGKYAEMFAMQAENYVKENYASIAEAEA